MIVYAESNFVLELALGREEAEAAEWILRRTEEGVCRLALPALALYEPFSTITARDRAQAQLARSLNDQLSELRRSAPHEEAVAALRRAPEILLDIGRSEMTLLEETIARLLDVHAGVHLDSPQSFPRAGASIGRLSPVRAPS